MWFKVSDGNIPENEPVIGYSDNWIDEDFNPDGIRECFINGDGYWISAKWCDYQDTYENDTVTFPTHWKRFPKFRKDKED